MQDNVRPHVARCVADYLQTVRTPALNWPANSSDLNHIEHVRDILKRRLRRLELPPESLIELLQTVARLWEKFPQDAIKEIISSMHRCCQTIIRAKRGHTRSSETQDTSIEAIRTPYSLHSSLDIWDGIHYPCGLKRLS